MITYSILNSFTEDFREDKASIVSVPCDLDGFLVNVIWYFTVTFLLSTFYTIGLRLFAVICLRLN